MFIANAWHAELRTDLKTGSMGRPLPGWSVRSCVRTPTPPSAATGVPGRVAIDIAASPLMWFPGYIDAPEKTASVHPDGRWYLHR